MWNYNPYYENYLAHYGIKGQQWGVRNGPPYPIERYYTNEKNNRKYIEEIYSSFSKEEKKKINPVGYKNKNFFLDSDVVIKSIVKKYGNVPVSFIAGFSDNKNSNWVEVAIGTRSGNEYRGKGYADDVTKKFLNEIKKTKVKDIYWNVLKSNIASKKVAERNNFVKNEDYVNPYWDSYYKKIH